MNNRYIIHKLGFVNFWYYDFEEFLLSDGKLLLRGSNGSGKSVTMQSFIPLLLDGNKSPYRLDPFGTNARTISGYLLDDENTERTGYLYMEFKRRDSEHFITLGMGIKAQQNQPAKSWYFILHDGRRINKDLFLYRDAGQKIPLTKMQLKNELGDANFYTESQRAYMAKVNEYLFGFDDMDSYEELLNLLISIRSPKLSKDFKPTEIYKILTDSLKVLSEDDLRPVSEALENMDSLKDSLEENQAALKATKNIKYHYDKYNQYTLREKANYFIQGQNALDETIRKLKTQNQTKANQQQSLLKITRELETLNTELNQANATYENLISGEGFRLKQDEKEIENLIENYQQDKAKKEHSLSTKKSTLFQTEKKLRDLTDEMDANERKLNSLLSDIDQTSKEVSFEAGRSIGRDDLLGVEILLKAYDKKIKEALGKLSDLEHHEKIMDEKERINDTLRADREKAFKDLHRSEELFSSEKENYKVSITSLASKNKEWVLQPQERTQLFSVLEALEKPAQLPTVQERLSQGFSLLQHTLNGSIFNVQDKIMKLEEKKLEINEDITKLQNEKDPEPERSEGVVRNRERLQELGIPFIPLYKAMDFEKTVSDKTRDAVESALYEMGLLDALIIEDKHRAQALDFPEGTQDRYLFSNPNIMSYNLSSLLKIDASVDNDDLKKSMDEILQSIFLEGFHDTYLDENAHFNLGILRGKADAQRKHIFIGEAARKRHKEERILQYKEEIRLIDEEILQLNSDKNGLELRMNTLIREYECRPSLADIESGLSLIQEAIRDLKNFEESIRQGEDEFFTLKEQHKEMKLEVFHLIKEIDLPKTSMAYSDAKEKIDDLKDIIRDSISLNHTYINQGENKTNLEEQLLILEEEVEEFSEEIYKIQTNINQAKVKLYGIKEALSKSNIAEIEAEIQRCIDIKNINPPKIRDFNIKVGGLTESISSLEKEIEVTQENISSQENNIEVLESIFLEEYQLGYVFQEDVSSPLKLAKNMLDSLPQEKNLSRDMVTKRLIDSFNQNSADLREYNLQLKNILTESEIDPPKGVTRERWDVQCKIQGISTGFIQLMDSIQATVDEQKLLISTEERHIFEEVLMNTVSEKIRAKILQSKDWIEKINRIMGGMNTTSTLKLSLTWIPNKAEEEGQLNVVDIIDILEKRDRNTEESLKKLAGHFILKVKETLRTYEGTGEARNYHSIIKEVLDYRKWYQFKLHFTMENERKKELTNNEFFKFSGGEKAMSMYIPLFSALYARYLKANKDCPRIITMDEAFAGVDEENIRDMFKLLKQLDLDYILNSQILWGTYDTVDNLAISELIRENNEKMVTVIRYHWNGQEKVLVDE